MGAFDQSSFKSIVRAARERGVDEGVIKWIRSMLRSRRVRARVDECNREFTTVKGTPQGGCISPLLWCLLVDDLIKKVRLAGGNPIEYADDLGIIVSGKRWMREILCDIMGKVIKTVEEWCVSEGLSVSAGKSNIMEFSKARVRPLLRSFYMFGELIPQAKSIKHLGVTIDDKMLWTDQIENATKKGKKVLWASRKMIGKDWGLSPKMALWIYNHIVIPKVTYGCTVWWHRAERSTNQAKLKALQRTALMLVTGAVNNTPGMALEALLGVPPLDLKIQALALQGCERLQRCGMWKRDCGLTENRKVEQLLAEILDRSGSDFRNVGWSLKNKFECVINEGGNWSFNLNIRNNASCWVIRSIKTEEGGVGIGSVNEVRDVEWSTKIEDHCSSMHADIIAIRKLVEQEEGREEGRKSLPILTGNKVAVQALRNPKISSRTVWECVEKLNDYARKCDIKIAWAPKNGNLDMIRRSAELARYGQRSEEVWEAYRPAGWTKQILAGWLLEESKRRWTRLGKQFQHSYDFILPFDSKRAAQLIRGNRKDIRVIVGLLTGRGLLQDYIRKLRQDENWECRYCGDMDENMEHLIIECDGTEWARKEIFGKEYPRKDDIKTTKLKNNLTFANKTEISDTFYVKR
jgi:hypothetical protein